MKTILVVEDNADDAELLRIALENNNIANGIEIVGDGVDALERLRDEALPLPAVVLLDLKLPRLGGIEVLRRLRGEERTRFLPVVILTSSREERDLVESYRLGANSYVRKPIEFSEFTTAVRQLGMYWILLNEIPRASPAAGMAMR